MLTQRILCLLARVSQPEAVLAITFTRKAAAEMRERLVLALESALGPEPRSEHQQQTWRLAREVLVVDARYGWQLLANPNRLQLRTFDSLCARLTQALPLQSSLGGVLMIAEDADSLYQTATQNFLQSLDEEAPWADALQRLLAYLDNQANKLSNLLQQLLQKRDAWLPLILSVQRRGQGLRAELESHLQQVCSDQIALITELIPQAYVAPLCNLAAQAGQVLQREEQPSPICACAPLDLSLVLPGEDESAMPIWQGLRHVLLTKEGQWRKRLDKNAGFPSGNTAAEKKLAKANKEQMQALIDALALRPGLQEALADLDRLPARRYSDAQWQALDAIGQLLPILVAHLRLVFSAQGQVDFIEIAQRAREALGDEQEPTDLALRLDHQIQHILVDEFQDTSESQYRLLERLTEGWQPGDGRSLFCVGDAMQSIYSFRAADVGLFLYAKEHGLGHLPLELLQLTTNFRSQAQVVDWINRVFAKAFPERNNFATGAVAFSPATAFNPGLAGTAVALHSFSGPEARHQEAQAVVALVENQKYLKPQGSIAILVRNRSQGRLVMAALQRAQLRPLGVDMASLASQTLVQDLLNLCCALLDPADSIAWLALLRAPWGGFSLNDLLAVRQMPGRVVLEQLQALCHQPDRHATLSPAAQARLVSISDLLTRAMAERLRKPLSIWAQGLWLGLGGPACLAAGEDLASAERFWRCLEGLSSDGRLPERDRLLTAVDKLFAAPAPNADPLLQVMTIHKSKGLEFDTVILPAMSRGTRRQDNELIFWQQRLNRHGEEQLLMSALAVNKSDDDSIYRHLKAERAKREAYEICRLVYVAATRARHQLHLMAEVSAAGEPPSQLRTPTKGSALAAIWPGVQLAWPLPPQVTASESSIKEAVLAPLQRLSLLWQMPELPEGRLLNDYIPPHNFGDNRAEDVLSPSDPLPRILGNLLHQMLCVMANQSLAVWRRIPHEQRRPVWRTQLIAAGLPDAHLTPALIQIEEFLNSLYGDPRLVEILNEPAFCKAEWPISWRRGNQIQHLRIDLLWHKPGSTPWLVDFKTATPRADESLSQFLASQRQAYLSTMKTYFQALNALGYQEISVALYFVALGQWLEYELQELA